MLGVYDTKMGGERKREPARVFVCVCHCVFVWACARVHDRAMALLHLSPVMWIHNPIQRENFVERLSLKNHSTPPQNTGGKKCLCAKNKDGH